MGEVTAIGAGIGAITSGALAIGGNNRKKRAEAELRNLVPPELRNYYSDVPLSTYGSRIASQNMAQNNANMINAGQRGGIRALSSIAPVLTEANIQQNQAIAQDIDRQYRENKQMEAQGATAIQGVQEQRYQNTLAGLQAERNAGLQDTYTGLSNLAGTVTSVGTTMMAKGLAEKQLGVLGKTAGTKAGTGGQLLGGLQSVGKVAGSSAGNSALNVFSNAQPQQQAPVMIQRNMTNFGGGIQGDYGSTLQDGYGYQYAPSFRLGGKFIPFRSAYPVLQ